MPLKWTRSRRKSKKFGHKIDKKKGKSYSYRHLTKAELIKKYENLLEAGRYYSEQFEDLRTEYLNLRDKFNLLQENNRELASRNVALLHENEHCRSQLTKFTKDQLIKITGAEKEFDTFRHKMCSLLTEIDPFYMLKQDYERSLSVDDISHLESITTTRNARHLATTNGHNQERIKEKLNNLFLERIDLTAMIEETSPIPSSRSNGSTFNISSKKDLDEATPSSHLNFTTLLDPPTNSTMVETPSFRRFIPKTPQLNRTHDGNDANESHPALDESDWEYNSDLIKVTPSEPVLSTTLDSIQNFIPKTPLLTQPVAKTATTATNNTTTRDSTLISEISPRKSFIDRLSVAFPEKTPDQSPITSFATTGRSRSSRRLINSTASRSVSGKYTTLDFSTPSASNSATRTSSVATSLTTTMSRISTARTSNRTINLTNEVQHDDSSDKTSNNNESNASDCETPAYRRSKRPRKKVCYRDR